MVIGSREVLFEPYSRYDGYDNQVGFHSLMEPTIAEIILQEKHVNQTNPASAKTSKQPAIQSSERPQVEACDFVTPHVVRPGEPYWKGERHMPGWLSAVKISGFFQDRIGSPSKSRDFFGDGQKLSLKSHLLKCSIRNSGSQGFYAFVRLIFVEIKSPHLYLLGFA